VSGTVHKGFESLREIFTAEVGSGAFAVVRDGEVLVDLWSGQAEDALNVLFSGTKGITAAVVAILTERGLLDPDERVSAYWPEFQADIKVSHVLSHTAGLPYVDADVSLLDNEASARVLATQNPLWTPGSRVAYHALTYGYLLTELIRHVTGSGVGKLIQELLAQPYGLDLHLGTDLGSRVAPIFRAPGYRISTFLQDEERRVIVDRMYRGLLDGDLPNSPEYRRAELSAASGLGTARAMAGLYDLLVSGKVVPLAGATRTWSRGLDAVNDRPVHFGLGFELPDEIGTYGPAAVAFGHSGAGGGRHGAWPEAGLGFSFTTGEMRSEDVDTRANSLLAELHTLV
jgi:CubicO group peptidase (beta-lactamase class C family)